MASCVCDLEMGVRRGKCNNVFKELRFAVLCLALKVKIPCYRHGIL